MRVPVRNLSDIDRVGRRAFLRNGVLVLMTTRVLEPAFGGEQAEPRLKIGLLTDLHYADKATLGNRHYRESLDKLAAAAAQLAKEQPAFVVELGDLIDAADTVEEEKAFLRRVNKTFMQVSPERHYVLGNHCVTTLTKNEFLGEVERKESYYAFDHCGYRFVVLDACFRGDGQPYGRRNFEWTDSNLPPVELEWLKADLDATSKQVIVFVHQRLDIQDHYAVKNAAAVRKVLRQSGKVLAVVQGHSHENDYNELDGVHYCTLRAMVEGSGADNNGYAVMSLSADGTIQIQGFHQQRNYQWKAT